MTDKGKDGCLLKVGGYADPGLIQTGPKTGFFIDGFQLNPCKSSSFIQMTH
jgi:hypothetical protein